MVPPTDLASPATRAGPPTAAVLLIGNELLSGKIRDKNGYALARMMRRRGIRLIEMATVEDDIPVIGDALLRLLARTPLVFTSGGVGPTHDDVTMAAIALATGHPLERHEGMETILRAHFKDKLTDAALKMADLPSGIQLRAGPGWPVLRLDVPTLSDGRIYILPGIPELCQAKINTLEALPGELPGSSVWTLEILETELDESDLAPTLGQIVAAFPEVEIGSYPRWTRGESGRLRCVVRVTFEAPSEHAERVATARARLAAALGPDVLETTAAEL
ncbi:MAG: hypothetical protein KC468_26555 [Myxococcales bacterium]|nr:hypothetical protein [Myxococcales bacterium]